MPSVIYFNNDIYFIIFAPQFAKGICWEPSREVLALWVIGLIKCQFVPPAEAQLFLTVLAGRSSHPLWEGTEGMWISCELIPLFSRWRMVASPSGLCWGVGWSRGGHSAQGHHTGGPGGRWAGIWDRVKNWPGGQVSSGVEKPGCTGMGRFINPPHGPRAKSWEAVFWDCQPQKVLKRKEWNLQTRGISLMIRALHLWLCLISLLKGAFLPF